MAHVLVADDDDCGENGREREGWRAIIMQHKNKTTFVVFFWIGEGVLVAGKVSNASGIQIRIA